MHGKKVMLKLNKVYIWAMRLLQNTDLLWTKRHVPMCVIVLHPQTEAARIRIAPVGCYVQILRARHPRSS